MGLELTQKQLDVFLFIQHFTQQHGFPPSIREIGNHFQIAPPSVLAHLKALEKKGFIRRFPFKPRCLEILKPSRDAAA
jgi:repressor LexA